MRPLRLVNGLRRRSLGMIGHTIARLGCVLVGHVYPLYRTFKACRVIEEEGGDAAGQKRVECGRKYVGTFSLSFGPARLASVAWYWVQGEEHMVQASAWIAGLSVPQKNAAFLPMCGVDGASSVIRPHPSTQPRLAPAVPRQACLNFRCTKLFGPTCEEGVRCVHGWFQRCFKHL